MGERVRITNLIRMREQNKKIVALTAYDFTFASLIDQAGVDLILVGDSLASVIQGEENTIPVTMDQMVYHTKIVRRGVRRALLVADLPFLSYQLNREQALQNAGRLVQEGGAEAVKLEGGLEVCETVQGIVEVGIPVIGHIGLTPQSVHRMGGFKVQGKSDVAGKQLLDSAVALEGAGAAAIILEGIPAQLASEITESIRIPTIGIGAGVGCSGQILVSYDALGLLASGVERTPKFVKQYASLSTTISEAVGRFADEVSRGEFPTSEHSYCGNEDVRTKKVLKAL